MAKAGTQRSRSLSIDSAESSLNSPGALKPRSSFIARRWSSLKNAPGERDFSRVKGWW
jgi:hypothetical protein